MQFSFVGAFGVIAPYFIEEPSNIYVRKGKPAVLNCRVGGDPKPSIKWKRNGITLTLDSRRMIKPDGSLYFSVIIHNKTQKPDEGTYQCEAVSYISVDYRIISRTARVIVAGKFNVVFYIFSSADRSCNPFGQCHRSQTLASPDLKVILR